MLPEGWKRLFVSRDSLTTMGQQDLQGKRTALLVRCTVEEAENIRQAAEKEGRTITGFILNAVMRHVQSQPSQCKSGRQPKQSNPRSGK